MKKNAFLLGFLLITFLLFGCISRSRKITNLETFARLYGYVRWFYPGDEATQIDWNKFAVYGIQKVENAKNDDELKNILTKLFTPFAPDVRISSRNENSLVPVNQIDRSNLLPVYWVHYGVELGKKSNIYKSIRINRDSLDVPLLQCFISDISKYCGKEIQIKISCKTSRRNQIPVFINLISGKNGKGVDTIIKSFCPTDKYSEFGTKILIKEGSEFLGFNIKSSLGSDTISIKNLKIFVSENGKFINIPLFNKNFEENLDGWQCDNFLYRLKVIRSKDVLLNEIQIYKIDLRNQINEFFHSELNKNLKISMPIILYTDSKKTIPASNPLEIQKLFRSIDTIANSKLTNNYEAARIANVIITWNVIQHFYPYFENLKIDWDSVLVKTLTDVYSTKNKIEYYKILSKMLTYLDDGHARVISKNFNRSYLPFKSEWIENKIIVTKSLTENFKKGDIILMIDGKTPQEEIAEQEDLISGSPQFKHATALQFFGSEFFQGESNVVVLRSGKKIISKVERRSDMPFFQGKNTFLSNGNAFRIIYPIPLPDIYYIGEHTTITDNDIFKLGSAKGVIVDGLFNRWKLLSHIIKRPIVGPNFLIPLTYYPDRLKTQFIEYPGVVILPKKPTLTAKSIFIVHSTDISSTETFLDYINHYKLGKLIGETSGGINGNINIIPLLDGDEIIWTGMKVLKQDGAQHHLIGYRPDYPVKRTIQAIKENRDEYLDKALEILKE